MANDVYVEVRGHNVDSCPTVELEVNDGIVNHQAGEEFLWITSLLLSLAELPVLGYFMRVFKVLSLGKS